MTSGALFGSGLGGSSGNRHLVEFRAGRMTLKGRMVHPDKRKGLVYVYQGEDSMMHFCWKDRTTGEVEDDLLIFPDDCVFVRVNECTTGRVYVLKFKAFIRRHFFWMQEPKSDKDDEYCRRVNEALNNPPAAGSGRGGGGRLQDSDLINILNSMSPQQLMQLFGGLGPVGAMSLLRSMGNESLSSSEAGPRTPEPSSDAAATPPPATQPGAGQRVVLSDVREYFEAADAPTRAASDPAAAAAERLAAHQPALVADGERHEFGLGNEAASSAAASSGKPTEAQDEPKKEGKPKEDKGKGKPKEDKGKGKPKEDKDKGKPNEDDDDSMSLE